jgi:hypothetical protein
MLLIIGLAAAVWLATLLLVVGLCAAAKRGDAAQLTDPATAAEPRTDSPPAPIHGRHGGRRRRLPATHT